MAEKINDGGPAFPEPGLSGLPNGEFIYGREGMTLRDYFAAHASEDDILEFMPATVGDARTFKERHGFEPTRQWARYQHADAMLKARGGQ